MIEVRRRLALRDWSSREPEYFLNSPGDVRFPAALAAIHDPPHTSGLKGHRRAARAVRGHCRIARRVAVRARSGARGSAPISRAAMSPSSAAWRAASIPRRTAARSKAAASPSRCSDAASTSSIRPSIAALAARIAERGALVSEFPPGMPPLQASLSAAQPHHQRPLARRRHRRGGGRQRLADYRRLRARAGAHGARGARQRAGRPQLRRARAAARRCKACGVCGRYPRGTAAQGLRDSGLGD